MEYPETKSVPAIHFDAEAGSAVQKHLIVRIEYVLSRITTTHAGKPVDEITKDMLTQLRALGVNIAPSQILPYARSLSTMPAVTRPAAS